MQTVTVRGVWLPGHVAQVAVWERDPRHPGGELYLTSGQIATVCLTPGVNAALVRGSLALVEPTAEPPAAELAEAKPAEPTGEPPSAEPVEAELAEARPAAKVTKVADTKATKRK